VKSPPSDNANPFPTNCRHSFGTLARMPRTLTTVVALAACTGVLALAAPAGAAPTTMERRLIAQINDARTDRGLRRLRIGPTIQAGAHAWARHLRISDSFHHARVRVGTGEVLAWGTCSWFSPAAAVRAWMRSPSHRYVMLRPRWRFVGAGWSRGSWQRFGCVEMAVARFR
jgi:uncharacterized protein YkwD